MDPFTVDSVYVDGTETNYYCLLRAMITIRFWRDPLRFYVKKYSQITQCKLILTTIDNQTLFYKLKSVLDETKTMFVQNGRRSNWLDIFETLSADNSYAVDIMCVFGSAIGEKYEEFIGGRVEVIGSFRNNSVEINRRNPFKTNHVLFVSSYVPKPVDGSTFLKMADGTTISWDQYYLAEINLFDYIYLWCQSNDRGLTLCPRLPEINDEEKEHFSSIIHPSKFEMANKTSNSDAYSLVDQAEIVVALDSTLAYEAICRSKNTAIFSARASSLGFGYDPFGWPDSYPDQGPFWSNSVSQKEVNRVMNYLRDWSLMDWEEYIKSYQARLMFFDTANSKLKKLITYCVED